MKMTLARTFSRVILLCLLVGAAACGAADRNGKSFPAPRMDNSLSARKGRQSVVLAGGCFWGVQAVFQHVRGVISAVSGYSGGTAADAHYDLVSTGTTGHAESVEVVFDPSEISFGTLLKIFFSVAHDPTELDRQGPDTGSQYRSVIFFTNKREKQIALAYMAQLEKAKVFPSPIVTQVVRLNGFYAAEGYHQNFAKRNPDNLYIQINDAPKVARLRELFPALYKEN